MGVEKNFPVRNPKKIGLFLAFCAYDFFRLEFCYKIRLFLVFLANIGFFKSNVTNGRT